jgi:hypothetical protein
MLQLCAILKTRISRGQYPIGETVSTNAWITGAVSLGWHIINSHVKVAQRDSLGKILPNTFIPTLFFRAVPHEAVMTFLITLMPCCLWAYIRLYPLTGYIDRYQYATWIVDSLCSVGTGYNEKTGCQRQSLRVTSMRVLHCRINYLKRRRGKRHRDF